jgi:hypothetical protein
MPRELGPAQAQEIIDTLRPGWEAWPQTQVLPQGFGAHIWGYYSPPEMARIKMGLMVFGIGITFIALAINFGPTTLGYYPAVIGSVALFLFLQFSKILKRRFDIVVTPATIAVGGRSGGTRSFDRSLEHAVSIEQHQKAQKEGWSAKEGSNDPFKSRYRESVEVVFRYLEQRIVLASFYRDMRSAERLHKRVFEIARAFS